MLKNLLSQNQSNFARYEGQAEDGKSIYVEFVLGQTDGWFYRYGRVGFPPVSEQYIGTDDSLVEAKIRGMIAQGYRLNDEPAPLTEQASAAVTNFHDWLRTR